MNDRPAWDKWNPRVPRRWLLVIAGFVWTIVGCMLCFRAVGWYGLFPLIPEFASAVFGCALAIAGYRLGFSKVAQKNIKRIHNLPERVCVFAFTAWKGYIMIGLMISIGITLRNSAIPKVYLAIPYTAMGGMLMLGSIQFYASFFGDRTGEDGTAGSGVDRP